MFVLRRITSEQLEHNECLGIDYRLIDQEKNPEDYNRSLKTFLIDEDPDIYGFIVKDDAKTIIPLYKKSTYFVMMSNGQTFANISFR